jgi:hypothetical protein
MTYIVGVEATYTVGVLTMTATVELQKGAARDGDPMRQRRRLSWLHPDRLSSAAAETPPAAAAKMLRRATEYMMTACFTVSRSQQTENDVSNGYKTCVGWTMAEMMFPYIRQVNLLKNFPSICLQADLYWCQGS